MRASLTQALAFFLKEFHDVRRQPRLLLSLVGGPLLVLGAFAATFQSSNPFIRTVLVWPAEGVPGVDRQRAEDFLGRNMYLIKVTSDEAEAMAILNAGAADAVQIIPAVPTQPTPGAKRPEIRVIARTVDPLADAWIRSLSMGALTIVNQALLKQEATLAQEQAQTMSGRLDGAAADLRRLKEEFDGPNIERAMDSAQEIRDALRSFQEVLPPLSAAQANLAPELYAVHRDARLLEDDLDELLSVMRQGDVATQLDRLSTSLDEMEGLQGTIDSFVQMPADDIITPVRETYTNLRGTPYALVIFYTPAVLALLLQQLAITLGALGLVRERQMGAFEMFRVSPLRFSHVLLGKSVAYILYVVVGGLLLTGLLALLKVPMPAAHPLQYGLLMVMLVAAATGIGFLVSALSATDSQAIQWTMLLLLLSIFFTGFFLPLVGFSWPAWLIAFLLPMTPAILGFQALLLWGESVPRYVWLWMAVLVLLSNGVVWLIMRRQYRRVTG
jgi:ABC-2 type transport system permease protein